MQSIKSTALEPTAAELERLGPARRIARLIPVYGLLIGTILLIVVFSIILVFIYYVVMSVARSLGNNGVVDPVTGAWIQNYLFAVVGLFLLWRIDR